MITGRKWVYSNGKLFTGKNKEAVPRQDLFQVLSQAHSHRGEQITENKVTSRKYAEISQKVVNTSIPCRTENAQQPMAAPTFYSLSPFYPNMLLGKITEIENHYACVVTKFGEVQ